MATPLINTWYNPYANVEKLGEIPDDDKSLPKYDNLSLYWEYNKEADVNNSLYLSWETILEGTSDDVLALMDEVNNATQEKAEEGEHLTYWNTQIDEFTNEESQNEDIDVQIDENPSSPLIDWFVSQWLLTVEEWYLVKKTFLSEWKIDDSIRNIEWIDSEKKEQIIESINYLKWEEGKSKCIEKFNKDLLSEIDWLKQENPWDNKWEKLLTQWQENLVEKLGWNYFSLWNENWNKETNEQALNKAFKTTLNQIIKDWWKTFKRPDEFDQMKWVINNSSLSFKERFNELNKVNNLVINSISSKIWKQSKDFWKMKKWVEQNWSILEMKFNEFQNEVQLAQKQKNYNKLKELLEVAKINNEKAAADWDIFVVSEYDKITEGIENTIKEE